MKKTRFLFAAAILLALGSAFAPKAVDAMRKDSPQYYRNVAGCPQNITCNGGLTFCAYSLPGCTGAVQNMTP